MKYYQEITLIDSDEKSLYQIWSMVYQQLHIALADMRNKQGIDRIGVSFPNYRYENKDGREFGTLGNKLRVFGTENDLKMFDFLSRLLWVNSDEGRKKWHLPEHFDIQDYVHLRGVAEVGNKASEYVVVRRYRYKNLVYQAQRFAAHHGINYDEALVHCQQYKANGRRNYPFINLVSSDTGQAFKLSIRQEIVKNEMIGSFSSYGLCGTTNVVTVPHW